VGFTDTAPNFVAQPLIEHFDGTSWKVVASAALPAGAAGELHGVAALSPTNVWAVGETITQNLANEVFYHTLIEHWNGTAWSIVASPNGANGGTLTAVTAISTNNVYAVGNTGNPNFGAGNLIEHWNGTSWKIVLATNTPAGFPASNLYGVSADAANDVWAVGFDFSIEGPEVLHFNGHTWSSVPLPTKTIIEHGFRFNLIPTLDSIVALAPNDVWVVGHGASFLSPFGQGTFIEHWDGTKFSFVPSPSLLDGDNLTGIAAISANNIWAVGFTGPADYPIEQTLTEHWNGTSWSVVPSPNATTGQNLLFGVTALSSGTVVAVGTASDSSNGDSNGIILSN
jgi:hypothetical protein